MEKVLTTTGRSSLRDWLRCRQRLTPDRAERSRHPLSRLTSPGVWAPAPTAPKPHPGYPPGARRRDPRGAVDDGADAPGSAPQAQDQLWTDLVRGIDCGYGVVMNIVAPPSRTTPRAVAPSTRDLRLPGRHRLSLRRAHGYGIDPDGRRRVCWADSGFPPLRQLGLLQADRVVVSPKGYVAASRSQPHRPRLPAVLLRRRRLGQVGSALRVDPTARAVAPAAHAPADQLLIHTEEGNAGELDLARYCKQHPQPGQLPLHAARPESLVQLVPLERAAWSVLDANAYTINGASPGRVRAGPGHSGSNAARTSRIAAYVAVRDCRPSASRHGHNPPYRRGSGSLRFTSPAAWASAPLDVGNQFPGTYSPPTSPYAGPPATGNLIDAEAARAKAWIGKRLTDGETALRGAGGEDRAFAEFEHAHIYWKLGASTAIAIPHADPALPGSGLFETWAADYRFELGLLGFPSSLTASSPTARCKPSSTASCTARTDRRAAGRCGAASTRLMPHSVPERPLGWPISGEAVPGTDNIRQRLKPGRWCGHRLGWPSSSTSSSSDRRPPSCPSRSGAPRLRPHHRRRRRTALGGHRHLRQPGPADPRRGARGVRPWGCARAPRGRRLGGQGQRRGLRLALAAQPIGLRVRSGTDAQWAIALQLLSAILGGSLCRRACTAAGRRLRAEQRARNATDDPLMLGIKRGTWDPLCRCRGAQRRC